MVAPVPKGRVAEGCPLPCPQGEVRQGKTPQLMPVDPAAPPKSHHGHTGAGTNGSTCASSPPGSRQSLHRLWLRETVGPLGREFGYKGGGGGGSIGSCWGSAWPVPVSLICLQPAHKLFTCAPIAPPLKYSFLLI